MMYQDLNHFPRPLKNYVPLMNIVIKANEF